MNPYAKAARFLLRLIATGLILIAGLNVGIELVGHRPPGGLGERHFAISTARVVVNSLGFLAGVILFALSSRLAARLTSRLDE
jgi:hypothetical protein